MTKYRVRRKRRINEEELVTTPKKVESKSKGMTSPEALAHVIQNPNPQNMTPDTVMQLQRTYGNQFTGQLLQRSSIKQGDEKPNEKDDADITKMDAYTEGMEEDDDGGGFASDAYREITSNIDIARKRLNEMKEEPKHKRIRGEGKTQQTQQPEKKTKDDYNPYLKQKPKQKKDPEGLEWLGEEVKDRSGKGYFGVGSDVIKGGKDVYTTSVDAKDAYKIIALGKEMNKDIPKKPDQGGSLKAMLGHSMKIAGTGLIGRIGTALIGVDLALQARSVALKGQQYFNYKALADKSGGNNKKSKEKARSSKTKLDSKAMVAAYAMQKTLRGFITRIIKLAMSIGQLISRIITIVSGGTTTLITEGINVSLSLAKGGMALHSTAKGFAKFLFDRRGKRRRESAETILQGVLQNGDKEYASIIMNSDVFGPHWIVRMKLGVSGNMVNDTGDMMRELGNMVTFGEKKFKLNKVPPKEEQQFLTTA
ncbi:MAG: hypothetical protein AAF125_06920, partial [Chloroflexota bacterium]